MTQSKSAPPAEDLLLATAQGDRAAFRGLYLQTRAQLFGVILRIVRRKDRAEDILQEAYLRIWNHAPDFRPEKGTPMAWMTTIARNRALDWVRRRSDLLSLDQEGAPEPHSNPGLPPLEWSNASLEAKALKDCLEELPKDQRDCILLAYVQGYTHDEVSAARAAPLGTVKSWIRRGLARLKTCLDR